MLKCLAVAATLAMPLLAHATDPEILRHIDDLPAKAAEQGYPVALGLEIEFRSRDAAMATHAAFVASGIRPGEFGVSEVREYDGLQPAAQQQPRSVKWFFRVHPYRVEKPEQLAQDVARLRALKLDDVSVFQTKLQSGAGMAPPPLPLPR